MSLTLTPGTAWIILVVAGLLEVVWVVGMKASDGFSRLPLTVFTIVVAWLSFWLLGLAMRLLPVGTAYAVWTGIGAVGAAAAGIAWFGDAFTLPRVLCIALIVCGILGLKLLGNGAAA